MRAFWTILWRSPQASIPLATDKDSQFNFLILASYLTSLYKSVMIWNDFEWLRPDWLIAGSYYNDQGKDNDMSKEPSPTVGGIAYRSRFKNDRISICI